jgi:hypothetical protein
MSEVILNFNIYDKEKFDTILSKIVKRYKVSYSLEWKETYTERFNGFDISIHPVEITLSASQYKIDGYTYLGCILDEDKVGLLTIHGNEKTTSLDIPEFVKSFKNIPCHKCNRKHVRKIGHLFLEEATNEIKVFGSGCAKKFFGIDFSKLLTLAERIDEGIERYNDDYLEYAKDNYFEFDFVSKVIYDEIKTYGYKSSSNDNSTKDSVLDTLALISLNDFPKEKLSEIKAIDKDFSILKTKEYDLNGEFGFNIKTIQEKIKHNYITVKSLGFLVWMIFDEFFKTNNSKVEFVHGKWNKGDKLHNEKVKFDSVYTFNGSYGLTFIYTFVKDNVKFKWFTTKDLILEKNEELTITSGTVKDLEDSKWGKNVIITRCKVKYND